MRIHALSRRSNGRDDRKYLKPALALGLLAGALIGVEASASPGRGHGHGHHHGHHHHHRHHGGAHIGLSFGAPLYWHDYGRPWYGAPYYRYDVLVPVQPPVYIERNATPESRPTWYFCSNPQGYYPYVKQCSTDWRAVAPESVLR